jgi:hypothetical protein
MQRPYEGRDGGGIGGDNGITATNGEHEFLEDHENGWHGSFPSPERQESRCWHLFHERHSASRRYRSWEPDARGLGRVRRLVRPCGCSWVWRCARWAEASAAGVEVGRRRSGELRRIFGEAWRGKSMGVFTGRLVGALIIWACLPKISLRSIWASML